MKLILHIVLFFCAAALCKGQQVLIDQGLNCEGLWCFPLSTNANEYVYLPNTLSLGRNADELPEFSFLRYVIPRDKDELSGSSSIQEAEGGAILHFLILNQTPFKDKERAEKFLKKEVGANVSLKGPILFKEANYSVVSSVLRNGATSHELLYSGVAPVLEGSKLAFSFSLSKEASSILMESFKMATPDLSIVFEMTFAGLSDSYDAKMQVNWDEVGKHKSMSNKSKVLFVKSEVEKTVTELITNNAIDIQVSGQSESGDKLLGLVIDKASDLIFQSIDPDELTKKDKAELVSSMLGDLEHNLAPVSLKFGHKKKTLKKTGTTTFTIKGRQKVIRNHFMVFNFGDFYTKYNEDEQIIKTVNIADNDFKQRQIQVTVDGDLHNELEKAVNNITVTFRKVHQSGKETFGDVKVNKKEIENSPSFTYGWDNDEDWEEWLKYEYKTDWSFQGGGRYTTSWTVDSVPMISLYLPYEYREIYLDGDLEMLENKGVKMVQVEVSYPFFGSTKVKKERVRPTDNLTEKTLSVMMPESESQYNYKLTWLGDLPEPVSKSGTDEYGFIMIDTINE